jgi:2-oxoglutarate dehydrogenase E2 component (dihydrolipoamide succinyltransferase)
MARKLAAEQGVDLASLQGTGSSGRITKSDVLAAAGANSSPPAPAPPTDAPPAEAPAPDGRGVRRERMSMLRQRIAERLVEAQHTAAMLTTFNEADMSAVMRLRAEHKEAFAERHGVGLGIVSFFVKACVSALQTFPRVNAFIAGDEIEYHDYVDISVAVGTERGLIVPVIRNTETLSFAEIERAIHDLTTRAREDKLSLDEMTGGTFTISNGGVYGSLLSTPIINSPQSAIIGLHKISKRPVEDPDNPGQIALRPMMNLALSYDHRIIDGEQAVKFLLHVRHQIEQPQRMLLGI